MTSSELFSEATGVALYAIDDIPAGVVLFPIHAFDGRLPNLVAVSAPSAKAPVIAAAGWWGKPGMNPEAAAVRANPALLDQLGAKPADLGRTGDLPATVRKARPLQVLRYKRGFVLSVATTLIVALAAVAAATLGFVTGTAPFAWGAVVLLLVCVAECAKAAADIRGAAAKS
ncbi:MAG: hypothetical protein WA687_13150 [Solirubrobacterales bacterium]